MLSALPWHDHYDRVVQLFRITIRTGCNLESAAYQGSNIQVDRYTRVIEADFLLNSYIDGADTTSDDYESPHRI